jgi:hypothetical protein
MQTSLLEVILRTGAIYAVLYVALRIMGKREISQFTPFDLVLLLVLANAVQNAMVGDNTSLAAGIAAALTLLLLNFTLDRVLSRHLGLRHWLEGVPTLLLRHGKIEWPAMKREHVDMAVLLTAIREHGLQDVKAGTPSPNPSRMRRPGAAGPIFRTFDRPPRPPSAGFRSHDSGIKKGPRFSPGSFVGAGAGLEPATFGL